RLATTGAELASDVRWRRLDAEHRVVRPLCRTGPEEEIGLPRVGVLETDPDPVWLAEHVEPIIRLPVRSSAVDGPERALRDRSVPRSRRPVDGGQVPGAGEGAVFIGLVDGDEVDVPHPERLKRPGGGFEDRAVGGLVIRRGGRDSSTLPGGDGHRLPVPQGHPVLERTDGEHEEEGEDEGALHESRAALAPLLKSCQAAHGSFGTSRTGLPTMATVQVVRSWGCLLSIATFHQHASGSSMLQL